jgi:hypothetical protein
MRRTPFIVLFVLVASGSIVGATVGATQRSQPVAASPSQPGITFKVGERVPVLEGVGLDGKTIRVDFHSLGRPAVVYSITPFGTFVVVNESGFAELVKAVAPKHAVYVVSGEDERLAEYVKKERARWGSSAVTVVGAITDHTRKGWRIGGYPRTLVVNPDGTVALCAEGTYERETKALIEAYFRIALAPLRRVLFAATRAGVVG